MSLLPKMESIFSIIAILNKMEYEFQNRAVLEMQEKLVIVATNPLESASVLPNYWNKLCKIIIDHQVDVYVY